MKLPKHITQEMEYRPRGDNKKRTLRRGTPNRRIIATAQVGVTEYSLHATKGYRARYNPS